MLTTRPALAACRDDEVFKKLIEYVDEQSDTTQKRLHLATKIAEIVSQFRAFQAEALNLIDGLLRSEQLTDGGNGDVKVPEGVVVSVGTQLEEFWTELKNAR